MVQMNIKELIGSHFGWFDGKVSKVTKIKKYTKGSESEIDVSKMAMTMGSQEFVGKETNSVYVA